MNVESQKVALRMVIVDDNVHFLDAARNVLQQEGIDIVGMASTSAEALQLVAELEPDVILVDVDLGEESGFDLARALVAVDDASVVLISAYPESDLADLIAASPVVGFVSKAELSARAVSNLLGNELG
jgi:DNA-binding NarL/FixJ family response regulator